MEFYDWPRTLSYQAPLTLVVGARGIGKTFGLRLRCVKDFEVTGARFVEVFRYKKELNDAARGYFDKLATLDELAHLEFRSDSSGGYARPVGKKRAKWKRLCYFVSLTRFQEAKKATFAEVTRIIFDEFILDRTNAYARYLPGEFAKFANVVDTVTRQRAGDGTAPHAFLLGNSVDLVNPYFAALGIDRPPEHGYRWFKSKTALLHMVPQTPEAAEEKARETLAGKLLALAGDETEASTALENVFVPKGETYIDASAKVEAPVIAFVWRGREQTVWVKDRATASKPPTYHVKRGIAAELVPQRKVFTFSKADARIDYQTARRGERALTWLVPVYSQGRLTAQTPADFETLTEVLQYFGAAL